jgi:hypothetical protein
MKISNKNIFLIFGIITLILSFSFGLIGFFYLIFSLFLGWLLLLEPSVAVTNFKVSKKFLLIPFSIFIFSHFLPFLVYGPHPLGYDSGFYKYNLVKERSSSFGDLSISEVESTGSRIINKALIVLGANDWFIIYGVYILACFLIGVMIYLLTNKYFGNNASFFAVYLYSLSFVQYLFYWNMFWKNAIAIFLSLLVFYLIEQKNKYYYLFVIPLSFFVFITHKTSAFILFLSLFIYLLFKKNKIKFFVLPIITLLAALVAWLNKDTVIYIWEQIFSGFNSQYDFFRVKDGLFIETKDFLKYSFWYLPFGILGFLISLKNKKLRENHLLLIFFILNVSMILTRFVFYKRIIPYLDLSLIMYSGLAIGLFADKIFCLTSKNYSKVFLIILLFLPLPLYFKLVYNQKPLVYKEEIVRIEKIKNIAPNSKLFTYNSYYMPWLYGFSGHKIIAPGWGDNGWNLNKWNVFWSSSMDKKIDMLKDFKSIFLIYDNKDGFFNFENVKCVEKINENLYLFKCE